MPEHSKIQLMFKRRFILSQYAKLIMYGVLPISDASQIFRYYLTVSSHLKLLQRVKVHDKYFSFIMITAM